MALALIAAIRCSTVVERMHLADAFNTLLGASGYGACAACGWC